MNARYIKALHSYLLSFIKRAQPLVDIESQQREAEAQFNQQWDAGLIEGWEDSASKQPAENATGIWCSACESRFEATAYCEFISYLYRSEDVLEANGVRCTP